MISDEETVRVCVVTPTLGRPTFADVLAQLLPQLGPRDEWRVVGDGPQPEIAARLAAAADPRIVYAELHDHRSTFGNAQRNLAMRASGADYFFFLDDDDELLTGAIDSIRRAGRPLRPLMFRMNHYPSGVVLPRTHDVAPSNVGGSMFVVPNNPGRLATWTEVKNSGYGDYSFITETLRLWPADSLEWRDDVLIVCRQRGWGRFHA